MKSERNEESRESGREIKHRASQKPSWWCLMAWRFSSAGDPLDRRLFKEGNRGQRRVSSRAGEGSEEWVRKDTERECTHPALRALLSPLRLFPQQTVKTVRICLRGWRWGLFIARTRMWTESGWTRRRVRGYRWNEDQEFLSYASCPESSFQVSRGG